MAGDWIKLEKSTIDKPEIGRIADALEIDPDEALGKCIRFWAWCDEQLETCHANSVTETGQTSRGDRDTRHAIKVTKKHIDRVTYRPGFADALLAVGWLESAGDGFAVPNFDRHNGKTAKTRAQATRRKQSQRETSRPERDNGHATSVTKARPEKRREEKSNNTHTHTNAKRLGNASSVTKSEQPEPHGHGLQPLLDHPAVNDQWATAWRTWLETWPGRMGKPFDPIAAEFQLAELAKLPPDKAERDLAFSIGKYAKSVLDSDNDFQSNKRGRSNDQQPKRKRRRIEA